MGVSAILTGTCTVILLVSPQTMEGLLPRIMRGLSLFERFEVFVSGTFDVTAIVYKNISEQIWGERLNYELMIDSSIGIDASVDTICAYLQNKA